MAYKSVLLLAYAFVSTKAGVLFDPCFKNDLKCLETATENFLSKTYSGSSQFGIKPIDPLIIPSKDIIGDENMGLVFYFKNINVTGLRTLKISDFKMDTEKKSVVLKTKADLVIHSDLKVGLTKAGKTFENGVYTSTATILGTSQYSYTLNEVDGIAYFNVGPETNTCEVVGDATVAVSGDLPSALSKDATVISLQSEWDSKKTAIRKKVICDIIDTGLVTIMHNLRTVAQAFPKTAFFKDI